MASYRLLRSNKESGPYSLNDLVKLGLKPYDLVWVDGRSAAWRYPSELSELKEFAPAVEEQPYDRFFKKPAATESQPKEQNQSVHVENLPPQKTINENFVKEEPVQKRPPLVEFTVAEKTTAPTQVATQGYQPQQQEKKVYVSMPEMNGFNPYTELAQEQKYEQYLPKPKVQQAPILPEDDKPYSAVNIRESDESKLETKYTQSLDDIKEMYINTLVQRKTRNKRKEIIKKVRPVLLPLLLVVVGIAIGYFINNKKNSLQASQSITKVLPQAQPEKKPVTPEQSSEDPLDQNTSPSDQHNSVAVTDNTNQKQIAPTDERSLIPQEKTGDKKIPIHSRNDDNAASVIKPGQTKQRESLKQQETSPASSESYSSQPVQKRNVRVDPTTGQRQSVVRDNEDRDGTENDKSSEGLNKKNGSEHTFLQDERKDIRDLVSIRSNNYIRGTFGGIRGLELTLFNNSDYLLDEVSVELQIMKPSEEPLRTDIITFRNINANATVTVKVPDSQRGIRVEYHITNVESKQWEKGTAGL